MIEGEGEYPVSKRTAIAYVQYLAPPLVLTLLWLLIPLDSYSTYAFSNAIYYSVAFVAWLAFYDMSIPGCRGIACILTYILFLSPLLAYYIIVKDSPTYRNLQLSFFLVAAIRLVAIFANYFIYVTYKTRAGKTKYEESAPLTSSGEERREKSQLYKEFIESSEQEAQVSWSSWLAHKLCFIESIDSDSVLKPVIYHAGTDVEVETATYKNLFLLSLYEAAIIAAWMWLDTFTVIVVRNQYFATVIGAALSVSLFQLSKIVLTTLVSLITNDALENSPFGPLVHFTMFQLQLMFLLYYRTLFISHTEWGNTIIIVIITVIIDIAYYFGRMTKSYYRLRYFTLPNMLDFHGISAKYPIIRSLLVPEEEPGYDKVINLMCIEYFYEKSAEYYSLLTAVIYISVLRALPYQREAFKSFSVLDKDNYIFLLERYAFLFLFELTTDVLLRIAIKRILEVDISDSGRDHTISNHRVRFLFSAFVLFNLMALYISQISPNY